MPKATEYYNLQLINPRLSREWHPTKNGGLTPEDVTPSSPKRVWWLCKKNGHEWQALIYSRNKGRSCPYCSGKAVCDDNCLATINPKLAKEWHRTKNGSLTPKDVTPSSQKKVWWLCRKSGHEWRATVANRNKGRGCPYCSGKAVCGDNCLATINPKLAKEWHPTKNGGLNPKNVTPGSQKKVWWLCKKNGHEWQALLFSRNRGNGCPYCSAQKKRRFKN